jgi:hypothetical protein
MKLRVSHSDRGIGCAFCPGHGWNLCSNSVAGAGAGCEAPVGYAHTPIWGAEITGDTENWTPMKSIAGRGNSTRRFPWRVAGRINDS